MEQNEIHGSEDVRSFYNSKGWKKNEEGKFLDTDLFESKNTGNISEELETIRVNRIRKLLINKNQKKINFLEAGCGANPAKFILDLCSHYTGVDFSKTGLNESDDILKRIEIDYKLVESDICELPFPDNKFDISYSAHVLYHIPSKIGQEKAFNEILRTTKIGGTSIFILANPRPILFPIRFCKRLALDTPLVGDLINKIRPNAVLPYKPHTIGWMKKTLKKHGKVTIISFGLSSTYIKQNLSEKNFFGKFLWKILYWLEVDHPHMSAYLGNYVALIVKKS